MISSASLTSRHWGALIAVLLVALLPGYFTIPTMDRDEARYSQAATQMMETGDYIDIRFQEQARHVKPVGIYWMQVATTQAFGGQDAPIWAYRLPSLISILMAAMVTAWLGARITGSGLGGVVAGLALGLSLAAAVEGRTAKTDAALLLAATFAQAALYQLLVRMKEPTAKFVGAPLIFWAATGMALIIKGPIVTMVSATTILGYGLWMRDWSFVRRLRILPGLLVAAAIALPWLIAIMIRTDGAFFHESVGHALMGKVAESDDSHAGPIGYHTLLLPVTFWPGTILLGLGAAWAWRTRGEATTRFLLAWILPTWIIFEIVATKLPHYILPTFPAIAVLAAWGFVQRAELWTAAWARRVNWAFVALFVLVALILAAIPIAGGASLGASPVTVAGVVVLGLGVMVAALGIYAGRTMEKQRLVAGLIGVLGVYGVILGIAIPRQTAMWPSHESARLVGTLTGCEELHVATAGYREPSNVFYLGTQTRLTDGTGAAQLLQDFPDCGVAIVEGRERDSFDAAASSLALTKIGSVRGHNLVKGRAMDLDVLVRTDGQLRQDPGAPGRERQ